MRAIDLEAKVLAAVDRVRAGQQAEHDLVECKASWPPKEKARQLAGSLNRAGGDPVIYIIGIDERTAKVSEVSDVDIADWWSQMSSRFDQTAPEMVRHIPVAVGDGETVTAVAFSSDRAPYVLKPAPNSEIFEVPIREGTRTRSARRDELLRMLIPAVSVPQVFALESRLSVEYYAQLPLDGDDAGSAFKRDESADSFGSARIYFEHDGGTPVTLPTHQMRGRIMAGDSIFLATVSPARSIVTTPGTAFTPMMSATPDGVTLTGPTAVSFDVGFDDLKVEELDALEDAQTVLLELTLPVLHAPRAVELAIELRRADPDRPLDSPYQRDIGAWNFGHKDL